MLEFLCSFLEIACYSDCKGQGLFSLSSVSEGLERGIIGQPDT